MLVTMALMLQAGPPAPPPPPSIDVRVVVPCQTDDGSEDIIVCGQKGAGERYRLRTRPEPAEASLLPKAETALAGGTLSAEGEAAAMPQGQVSRRAMVRFKIPF